MKKQRFSINKWREAETKKRKFRKECVIFMAKHPITWVTLMIVVAYTLDALGIG
jgi:hypothetical protein